MLYLPENLKKYRIKKNLTQEEVAEFLGITPQSVSKWERGESYPDITFLPALANIFEQNHGFAFGMTTFALFLGTLPSMLGDKTDAASAKWIIPLVVLTSAVFLGIGLICYDKIQKTGDKKQVAQTKQW